MKLRIKSKIASAHRKMEITGSEGQVLYRVHSKVVSLHGTTFLTRENGDEVAVITANPMSLRDTHRIEMADGSIVDIRTELLHLTKDVLDIDTLGWYLSGDLVQHNYKLMDSEGRILAQAHRKWMSLHNTYELEVEDESQLDSIMAVLVALERIVEDRQRVLAEPSGNISAPGSGQ